MERRVAVLIASGRTDAEVAAELGLGVKTVEWLLTRATRKLGVRSRSDLAAVIDRGSLDGPAKGPSPTYLQET